MATSSISQVWNNSGSNTNGYYCKMPDGTLFQWNYVGMGSITANVSKTVGVTFPVEFYAIPVIVTDKQTGSPAERSTAVNNPTKTGFDITVLSTSTLTGLNVFWFAIGRWKA